MKPSRLTGRVASRGFNLFEAMVVSCVLAVLIAMYLPKLNPRRYRCGQRINCANNLKQIGLSFKQWSLDNQDKFPMQVPLRDGGVKELIPCGNAHLTFTVMSNELNTPKILLCSDDKGGGRVPATIFGPAPAPAGSGQIAFTKDNLSYFLGVDATEVEGRMILAGDDNLMLGKQPFGCGLANLSATTPVGWTPGRHNHQGHILLVDGSVRSLTSAQLRVALAETDSSTNRLWFPGPPSAPVRPARLPGFWR